jgi:hypothetical protein
MLKVKWNSAFVVTYIWVNCVLVQNKEFLTPSVVAVFIFNDLMWKVVIYFVDISGIINHHYLSFYFISS